MGQPKNLLNQKFSKLTVVQKTDSYQYRNKLGRLSSRQMWICKCDCGNLSKISTSQLTRGLNTQCQPCAYASRKQSTRRYSAIERLFKLRIETNAKNRGIVCSITPENYLEISSKNCHYCNKEAPIVDIYKNKFSKSEQIKIHGLDRIDNTKGYELGNIVSCCKICNIMKSTLTTEEFFSHIKQIIQNIKEK